MRRSFAAAFAVASTAAFAACALAAGAAACTSSDDSSAAPRNDAGTTFHSDAAPPPADGSPGGPGAACVTNPQTYLEIINACTDAQAVDKTDDLSVMNLADGGLRPLP